MGSEIPSLRGKTLLLVEDDPTLAPFLEMLLSDSGARILTFMAPDAAMLSVESVSRLDLLVTDVVLPGKSGFQLAAELSRLHPEIRVLFMSGFGDPEIGARDLVVRYDTLLKPFLPEDFLAKIVSLAR